MFDRLVEHRELLFSLAYFGTLGLIVLWETVAELRVAQKSPLLRWSNNIAIWLVGIVLERWMLLALGLTAAMYAQHSDWGLVNGLQLTPIVSVALSVLFLDLLFYFVHRVWHVIPVLWRIHRVHHSDTEFDFSLALRRHPLESLINAIVTVPLIVLSGISPEAIVLFQALRSIVLMFEHANISLPAALDTGLRFFIVTPDMHRIHHSSIKAETDSNFSDMLPIWDRLFGTYRHLAAQPQNTMQIGIEKFREDKEIYLHNMLLQPFR